MNLEEEIAKLEKKSSELSIRIADEEHKLARIKDEKIIVADAVNSSGEKQRTLNRDVAELTKAVAIVHDERVELECERDALRKDITFYEAKKDGLKSKILEVEDSMLK